MKSKICGMNDLKELVAQLRKHPNGKFYEEQLKKIEAQKKKAQAKGDEDEANLCWAKGEIIEIHRQYLKMYDELKRERYYDGWCTAEQTEIIINSLLWNYPEAEPYVCDLKKQIRALQATYPYRLFFSTVILVKKEKCTICGRPVSILTPCPHIVGKVYNGELCQRVVTNFELKGIDAVENPEHKYCVPMFTDGNGKPIDLYDYSKVTTFVDMWRNLY